MRPSRTIAMEKDDANELHNTITVIKRSPSHNDTTNVTTNGILSPPTTPSTTTPSENDFNPSFGQARLKIYRGEDVILELLHQPKGDGSMWKWTNLSFTGNNSSQQKSTSFSVFDDNSSIQSPPWHRDRCIKLSRPKRNINCELQFMMKQFPQKLWKKDRYYVEMIRKRRRRPYDLIQLDLPERGRLNYRDNVDNENLSNDCHTERSSSSVEEENKRNATKKKFTNEAKKIIDVIDKLIGDRKNGMNGNSGSFSVFGRSDSGILSPRKRILREMGRVSLTAPMENDRPANKKLRARNINSTNSKMVSAPLATTISSYVATNNVKIVSSSTSAFKSTSKTMSAFVPSTLTSSSSNTATMASSSTTTTTKSTNSHSISAILNLEEASQSELQKMLITNLKDSKNVINNNNLVSASSRYSAAPEILSNSEIRVHRPIHRTSPSPTSSLSSPPLSYITRNDHLPPIPFNPYFINPALLQHSTHSYLACPPISNHPPYFTALSNLQESPIVRLPSALPSLPRQSPTYPFGVISSCYHHESSNLSRSPIAAHSSYAVINQSLENGTDAPLNLSKH